MRVRYPAISQARSLFKADSQNTRRRLQDEQLESRLIPTSMAFCGMAIEVWTRCLAISWAKSPTSRLRRWKSAKLRWWFINVTYNLYIYIVCVLLYRWYDETLKRVFFLQFVWILTPSNVTKDRRQSGYPRRVPRQLAAIQSHEIGMTSCKLQVVFKKSQSFGLVLLQCYSLFLPGFMFHLSHSQGSSSGSLRGLMTQSRVKDRPIKSCRWAAECWMFEIIWFSKFRMATFGPGCTRCHRLWNHQAVQETVGEAPRFNRFCALGRADQHSHIVTNIDQHRPT